MIGTQSPLPTVYEFSSGYYMVRGFYVQPDDTISRPVINERTYGWLQEEYYQGHATPIVFRKNDTGHHFAIEPGDDVAVDVIEMPFDLVDDLNLDIPPAETMLMMAKPRHARTVHRMQHDTTMR